MSRSTQDRDTRRTQRQKPTLSDQRCLSSSEINNIRKTPKKNTRPDNANFLTGLIGVQHMVSRCGHLEKRRFSHVFIPGSASRS